MTDKALLAEAQLLVDLGAARALRKASGISMTGAAETIEVVPSTISRWESGERRLSGAAGLRYARLLDLLRKSAQ